MQGPSNASTPDTRAQWYVVYCTPLKERSAAAALAARFEVPVYVPEVPQRFRGKLQQTSLFPRYFFVRADLRLVTLNSINTTPGVVRVVSFGGVPAPIPAATIEMLRERADEISARGGLPEQHFTPGETVRFTAGPLDGLQAIFVGPTTPSERVRVLIEFLGRLQTAEVSRHNLERVGAAPPTQRRTRGQGRRVKAKAEMR